MKINTRQLEASTLVVTITVVATILVLLGTAVEYTSNMSRNTQRSRKTALAVEIADGHLETLFTNWRNIFRASVDTYGLNTGGSDYGVAATNYFATPLYTPSPLATTLVPPVIPTPPASYFPSGSDYTLTKYSVQAVDPMITLDSSDHPLVEATTGRGSGSYTSMTDDVVPPGAYGPSLGPFGYYYPYSFYYLASADVQVPALNGNVTAKVRRVFEKKFDLPWSYLLFYVDDLELQPGGTFTLNGPIHTNASLYISTSNLQISSPTYGGSTPAPTSGRVEYGTDYVNGYSPKDSRYPCTGCTAPTFAKSDSTLALSDCPPAQVAPYLPFGWNLSLSTSDGSGNNDGYHEIVEPPVGYPITTTSSPTDALANVRYYNQAGIKVFIDYNNYVTVFRSGTGSNANELDATKIVQCTSSSSGVDYRIWKLIAGPNGAVGTYSASTGKSTASNLAISDAREAVNVRMTDVDMNKITAAVNANSTSSNVGGYTNIDGIKDSTSTWKFNGVIYIGDTTPAYDDSGNRVVIPNSNAVTVGGASFVSSGVTKAKLGTNLVTTSERAIRLTRGWAMPTTGVWDDSQSVTRGGLTVVSLNPVYIQGNYNTASTNTGTNPPSAAAAPASNTTATAMPQGGTYTRQAVAVIADAINVLSNNWKDADSTSTISGGSYNATNPRAATSTTINAALAGGIVPTSSAGYSGGAETFIRLQEDWRTQYFVYWGSISQFFSSVQGNTAGAPSGQYYKSPNTTRWVYDYATFADYYPPGNLQIAAYLQQQRWYQVY